MLPSRASRKPNKDFRIKEEDVCTIAIIIINIPVCQHIFNQNKKGTCYNMPSTLDGGGMSLSPT